MRGSVLFRQRTWLLIAFSATLACVAGFRLLGLDRDFWQYDYFYNLSDFQIAWSRFEPGFRWLAALSHSLGFDFWLFLLGVAFLSVPLKIYVIAKTSNRCVAPWLYYIPYFFVLFDMTAVRVGLASAVMLVGVYIASIGRRFIGLILISVSVLFHFQMFVPIFMISAIVFADGIASRYRRFLSWIVLGAAVVGVFVIARYVDLSGLGTTGEWAARYVDSSQFSGAAWYQPLVIQSIILLWLGRCALKSPVRLVRIAWLLGVFGVLVYYVLSKVGAIAFRISEGVLFFNLIWLGYAARNARKIDRILMYVCLVLFGLFYWVIFYFDEVPFLRFAERWSMS